MKKQYLYLSICTLAAFSLFSCNKTVKTEEKNLIKKYYLTTDTAKGAINIDLDVEIPIAFADTSVLKAIRKTIITNLFGPEYVSLHNDTILNLFAKELITDYKANNEPLVNVKDSSNRYSFNNEHTLSGFSLLSDKKIYVYGIERYVDMGGAHGLETRNYYNFDLKTGNLITENDIFKPNYKFTIAELLKKRIVEDSKDSTDLEPVMSIEDTDFWSDSIKPNGNFYITDEGINYVFNPYEIAPYYMGQTEVSIPYIRLKDIIKPNCIIFYLAEKQLNQ